MLNSAWHRSLNPKTEMEVCQNEIYAPSGIWVAVTLGDHYQYPAQDEVCFVVGITPQYIRSTQRFRLIAGTWIDEAYLLKGDSYALVNFASGTTNDYIIDGVKNILPNWLSLRTILSRKNRGLDVHDLTKPDVDCDHDELQKSVLHAKVSMA
ncbi:unnamed protein product [Ilex paraguariensis]|uniref:Pierisin-like domain-containing protein n=1 Tax=Ilex paraguariensis TaxID=185542 RepID=A0ABC8TQD8_9AQUA